MASAAMQLLLLCLAGCSLSLAAKWSYVGQSGPLYWHELFPHACSGLQQSPIDLKSEETVYNPNLKDFAIWYDPPKPDSKMYIKNNGHTVQVDLVGDFFVTNGGLPNVYKAAQFHFHWGHKVHFGSEHLMEGKASPIEMHLVTYNQDLFEGIGQAVTEKGGLAVLGVMFEMSKEDNPVLKDIVRALKHVRDPEKRTRISLPLISLRDLMPDDISRYYRYNGSLTTPGCFESVTWTVFDTKQTISHKQLKEFRTLLQFRRHHNKNHHHNKHNNGTEEDKSDHHDRHRRSLTTAQRKAEHRAEQVREELGIKGDDFQEALLKAELLERRQDRMMADMPQGHSHDADQSVSKPHVEESHQSGHKPHESEPDAEPKYDTVQPTAEVEIEFTQDILVNNYRPVQPLNDRMVQRSFKLREPVRAEEEHDDPQAGHAHLNEGYDVKCSEKCRNDATRVGCLSAMTLLLALFVSAFFGSRHV
ncbi:carbonic anhydrase 6 [Aplysia californica]|uniref:carbonic anhydrase n=1 Tax=Aplysia californica TaxID=6500 RepID=A0ABM0K1S6_APLCA|nr:carbonic anhydrase 6 [Aplysia californica]